MAESHTPPPQGSPVWLEIPALDVERAKTFYTTIFPWTFKPATDTYPAHKLAMFILPGCEISGGISLVEDGARREAMMAALEAGVKGAAAAGMATYFLVASIEETLEKIEKAGGKIVRGKEMEGNHGWHAVFADTEGNRAAVYKFKEGEGSALRGEVVE